MVWNGNVLTAKISASPSQETACTLSDILMSDVEEISGLCNNANQLAHRANSTGMAGQQSVDEMMRIAKEVWREIKENY